MTSMPCGSTSCGYGKSLLTVIFDSCSNEDAPTEVAERTESLALSAPIRRCIRVRPE